MSDILKGRLPVYVCHKEVHAAMITGFSINNEMIELILGEVNATVVVDNEWTKKHNPQIGGYYVLYEDGYASFSPKKPFESGYKRKHVSRVEIQPVPRG